MRKRSLDLTKNILGVHDWNSPGFETWIDKTKLLA